MQDSLEDYIRISKNAKQDESAKLSKEIQITAQRKKECDIRAMKIVEFSIEGKLRPEIFTKCLPFINQSHYQDIVEERAISKLCGYSVCGRRIPDMPKKQFFISTKNNKVYDISDRKNYCSNFCYKASLHIKKQIDNGPLWLRKLEDIPEYNLLPVSEGGLPGELVDYGIAKPVESSFTSVTSFAEISLGDVSQREIKPQKVQKVKGSCYKKPSRLKSTMQTISENEKEQAEEEEEEACSTSKTETENNKNKVNINKKDNHIHKKNCVINLPAIVEIEEKVEIQTEEIVEIQKENTQSVKKSSKKSGKTHKIDIEATVKKCLREWLTLESYIFIHGESKVKEVLNEKKLSDYFEALNVMQLQKEQQIKYMDICKRLQFREMADEKFDNALIGNPKLKPLPDYKKLKEENKELNVKVKSFYSGALYEKEDTNFPTKINNKKEGEVEETPQAVLPLVDVSSQNALRRKIFLGSITKAMHQLLQSLRVAHLSSVLSDVQTLVKTFKLKSDNIVFKPIVWNYICLFLLNILSIRDENIKMLLEEKRSQEYIELILGSLPNKSKFVNDIMTNIKNIDSFVESYVTSCDV